jgi:hypothetical protein
MNSLRIEIENQLNPSHPCILAPIGFIFRTESTVSGEIRCRNSLAEVMSMNPLWWTTKAKAIAGIVLSLRFAHSLGLIRAHLNSRHMAFDMDHRIQITDVDPWMSEDDSVDVLAFINGLNHLNNPKINRPTTHIWSTFHFKMR